MIIDEDMPKVGDVVMRIGGMFGTRSSFIIVKGDVAFVVDLKRGVDTSYEVRVMDASGHVHEWTKYRPDRHSMNFWNYWTRHDPRW